MTLDNLQQAELSEISLSHPWNEIVTNSREILAGILVKESYICDASTALEMVDFYHEILIAFFVLVNLRNYFNK